MVSIKRIINLESSDSTFRRKKMAKRIGKYKVTNRESAISLVDGGTIGGNLSVSGTSTFGGVVTDVEHRVSRQGKGWASFTIEEYTSNYQFRIFGEEYLKFRHFLMLNSFVYIRAFVREGWLNRDTSKKGEPRVQFINFQLLHDVMDYYAKKISIQLNIKKKCQNCSFNSLKVIHNNTTHCLSIDDPDLVSINRDSSGSTTFFLDFDIDSIGPWVTNSSVDI